MWEGMAEKPIAEVDSVEEAETRVQELLTQALSLMNQAKQLGAEWDLSFYFLGMSWSPRENTDAWTIENDIEVREWQSSWSPGW